MNAGQITGELRLLVMQLEDEIEFILNCIGPRARQLVEAARGKPSPHRVKELTAGEPVVHVVPDATTPSLRGKPGARTQSILNALQPGEARLVSEIHARMDDVSYDCVGVTLIAMTRKGLVERSGERGMYRYSLPRAKG